MDMSNSPSSVEKGSVSPQASLTTEQVAFIEEYERISTEIRFAQEELQHLVATTPDNVLEGVFDI